MSTMTVSQMEALLLDRIAKAKTQLEKLNQKHKLDIGTLAYKHGLNNLDLKTLENVFAKIAREVNHEHA